MLRQTEIPRAARGMKKLEHFIESIILASRWLLVVFYLGLTLALGLYAVSFAGKLFEFVSKLFTLDETDTILKSGADRCGAGG